MTVDPRVSVAEDVDPRAHGHGARHAVPLAHFEDHVGDPGDDEGDFCLDVAYGFDAEGEVWKVFVDDGEDGLVGDAVAGVSGGSADEPGFGLVKGSIDVAAEGWGHGFGVCFGGWRAGCCQGVLPVLEHGE